VAKLLKFNNISISIQGPAIDEESFSDKSHAISSPPTDEEEHSNIENSDSILGSPRAKL
jgi:hypothetical protein